MKNRRREEWKGVAPLRVAASARQPSLTRQKGTLIGRCVAVLLNSYGNANMAQGSSHKPRYRVTKSK